MNLLNFLIYWSSRVYEWFGWLYERGREAALYAFSWALQKAAEAFHNAVTWANDRVSGALSTAWSWIVGKYNDAISYTQYIRNWLSDRIDSVFSWVEARLTGLADLAASIRNGITDWVASLVDGVYSWIERKYIEARDYAASLVNGVNSWITSQFQDVRNTLTSLQELVLTKDANGTPTLLTFLSNPLGFIMAFIWYVFQDLLCFGLAYGLGTTKYDLPDLPDWNTPSSSGSGNFPVGIDPDISGLARPLNSLSVSGYTFSSSHPGVDFGLSSGDPVYSIHNGSVLVAEFSSAGYGLNVVISGGDYWSRYAHLQALAVKAGDKVSAGQTIGLGDSTGNSTGPHLHLEVKYKGNFINPLTLF